MLPLSPPPPSQPPPHRGSLWQRSWAQQHQQKQTQQVPCSPALHVAELQPPLLVPTAGLTTTDLTQSRTQWQPPAPAWHPHWRPCQHSHCFPHLLIPLSALLVLVLVLVLLLLLLVILQLLLLLALLPSALLQH